MNRTNFQTKNAIGSHKSDAAQKLVEAILKKIIDSELLSGEGLAQSDWLHLELANAIPELVDEIVDFEVVWKEY